MNKFFAAVALSALTVAFSASQMQAAEVASTVAPTAKTEQATPVVKKHPVAHHVTKKAKSPIQKASDVQPAKDAKSTETKSEAKPTAKVEEKKTDVKAQPQIGQATAPSTTTPAVTAPATPAPSTQK